MHKSVLIILGAFLVVAIGAGVIIAFNGQPGSDSFVADEPATNQIPGNTSTDKVYSLAEISKHSDRSDCWMVIDGGVYDVTRYISAHPGGESIVDGCGTDATELFHNRPDREKDHSQRAVQLLKSFKIGTLQ